MVFFIDRSSCLARETDSREEFQKKDLTKPRKSQTVTSELGSNTLPSIFSADLSKVYRKTQECRGFLKNKNKFV